MKKTSLCIMAVSLMASMSSCADKCNKNTSKLWLEFVEAQKNGGESMLHDYSYAGYHHAEKEVPTVNHKVFNVCDFGAVANDKKSDREAFQAAIAAAEAHGSGIIYFPAGRFDLHGKNDPNTTIKIQSSNIVMRGAGAGADGTEIFMEYPNPATDPKKMWTSPTLIRFSSTESRKKIANVVADAPVASFSVQVSDASTIKVGDWVCLELKNNDPELIAEELYPYSIEKGWNQMKDGGVVVNDYHQVTKVDAVQNIITFKEPLMKRVDKKWGWFISRFTPLTEVGVEDICFTGNFNEIFVHHGSWYHDGGYKALNFTQTAHSWIRNCRFVNQSECVTVAMSANVSIMNCVIDGNEGHASMRAQGSSRVFFGKIIDKPSMWHSTGMSKPSMGTVLWRNYTSANSSFESHASQPRATLFDMCEGGFMRGRAGGAIGSNPNHLADLTFWNYCETDEAEKDFDFWATDTPYWKFMPPIFVGFHGSGTTFVQDQVKADESHGTPVYPESLYEAQLELRLGEVPQWLLDLKSTSLAQ